MSELNEQLHETTLHIDSALKFVENGNTISDEAAYELSRLMHRAEELRTAAIRHDRKTHTLSELSAKYVMPFEAVRQVLNIEGDAFSTDLINSKGHTLLELAPLAITDVRGERIIETMRKNIAERKQMGVTVVGPHVTVRFQSAEKTSQHVSMLVLSVVDSSIGDEG